MADEPKEAIEKDAQGPQSARGVWARCGRTA